MAEVLRMPPRRPRHHWADWVGFLFCVWVAGAVLRRSPLLGFMMLPACLHELVAGVTFLLRRAPRARLQGWGPRVAAYSGTFLFPAFFTVAGNWRPSWAAFTPIPLLVRIGYCVWLVGVVLGAWTVWRLRSSFSVVPQARELVCTGPYRLARHPIYTAYILQYLGMWLGHFTLPFGVTLLVWFGLMCARVHYEEMVLGGTFPEYAEYRRQVGMFGPRLFPAANEAQEPARQVSTGAVKGSTLSSLRTSGRQIGSVR